MWTLRPESHNRAHEVMKLNVAKHILEVRVAVGGVIPELRDTQEEAMADRLPRGLPSEATEGTKHDRDDHPRRKPRSTQ